MVTGVDVGLSGRDDSGREKSLIIVDCAVK